MFRGANTHGIPWHSLRVLCFLLPAALAANSAHRKEKPIEYSSEEERVAEFERRYGLWPPAKLHPDTPGWKEIMDRRFTQIQHLSDMQQKWDGWLQTIASALTMPNFTEYGWALTQGPESLTNDLVAAIHEGLPRARPEGRIPVIDGPNEPLFVHRPDLTRRTLNELQPILEAWSGMQLVPSIAYGFRIYRNESSLWMHVDKTQTHVISCIYHIASSEDSEPWPIVIEDYSGTTNEVVLKSGDMLLYESAKNFHGRPRRFNGSWYTSVFVHYYPRDGWSRHDHEIESHYAVPPTWHEVLESPSPFPPLEVVSTSFLEPECVDNWCSLQNSTKWEGPGEYGVTLTGGGKRSELFDTSSAKEEL